MARTPQNRASMRRSLPPDLNAAVARLLLLVVLLFVVVAVIVVLKRT